MMGLLVKDLCLFKQRIRFFLILAVFGVFFAYNYDGEFAVGYLTLMCSFFTSSTLTYDEFDNCYPFLMTLPVTAKTYVIEKYIFGFVLSLGAWIFSTTVYFACNIIKKAPILWVEDTMSLLIVLSAALILLSIMLPVTFKFGTDKSRIVIIIIAGITVAFGFCLSKFVEHFQINPPQWLLSFNDINISFVAAILIALSILITILSTLLSIRIMNKKEF